MAAHPDLFTSHPAKKEGLMTEGIYFYVNTPLKSLKMPVLPFQNNLRHMSTTKKGKIRSFEMKQSYHSLVSFTCCSTWSLRIQPTLRQAADGWNDGEGVVLTTSPDLP